MHNPDESLITSRFDFRTCWDFRSDNSDTYWKICLLYIYSNYRGNCKCALYNKIQSLGAVYATLVAETTVTVLELYRIRKVVDLKQLLKKGLRYTTYSLAISGILELLKHIIDPSLVILVTCGKGFYMLLLFIFKDEMMEAVLMQIRERFRCSKD